MLGVGISNSNNLDFVHFAGSAGCLKSCNSFSIKTFELLYTLCLFGSLGSSFVYNFSGFFLRKSTSLL